MGHSNTWKGHMGELKGHRGTRTERHGMNTLAQGHNETGSRKDMAGHETRKCMKESRARRYYKLVRDESMGGTSGRMREVQGMRGTQRARPEHLGKE